MVLFFICILILVAVPLNLLGLSGPTGILFTALNLGQYAFTIGALSLLAFRVVKLRAALASILLMVQSFMVVEMLHAPSIRHQRMWCSCLATYSCRSA